MTLPSHLGSIPEAMAAVMRRFGADMREGDVFALNDPFEGGMHLPDIFVFRPESENALPGSISQAAFDGDTLVLEYFDKEGLGTFTR